MTLDTFFWKDKRDTQALFVLMAFCEGNLAVKGQCFISLMLFLSLVCETNCGNKTSVADLSCSNVHVTLL